MPEPAADWRRNYVLGADDINTIADHVASSDPRATHVPNGSVASLIAMLRDAEAERDWLRATAIEVFGWFGKVHREWGYGPRENAITPTSSAVHAKEVARRRGERRWHRTVGQWFDADAEGDR